MPTARYIESNGVEHAIDVPVGDNLKQAALDNLVPGIIGDCGGYATCGTCHGYIEDSFLSRLAPPTEDEEVMLEGMLAPVTSNSRLTCQLTMTAALDGITVHFPEEQG
ncbi:2Fe-2S iron-sulfur cluster-binding protein [Mycobacterium sp. NPDC003449]